MSLKPPSLLPPPPPPSDTPALSPEALQLLGKRSAASNPVPPPPKPVYGFNRPEFEQELKDTEADLILRGTLKPNRYDDPRILVFISSYLNCRSKSQAARQAGFAASYGYTLVMQPDIYDAIRKLTVRQAMKYGYDENEVIERVKEIAEVDPIVFYKSDGSYVTDLSQIPAEVRRTIKKFKVKNEYERDPNGIVSFVRAEIIEIEIHDKMKAHELMGKEKKMFKETKTVEHDVSKNMAAVLLASSNKADERRKQILDVTPTPQLTGQVPDEDTD